MDKAERKRLKSLGKDLVERRSQDVRAALNAENPWPIGSAGWVARYKELHHLRRERGDACYTVPARTYGGVLAEVYLAREQDALAYDSDPESFADRTQIRGVTTLELSMLGAFLRGVEWDVALMDQFICLFEQGVEERSIYKLPVAMVADLAALSPTRIETVTPQWAGIEELGWTTSEAQPVIEDLVRLARLAIESRRNMYLWNCI